jgi:hypothetical protein
MSAPKQISRLYKGDKNMETTLLPAQTKSQANIYKDIFLRQKAYFASNVTKSFEWRLDQLDRLAQMLSEHTNEF